MKIGYLMQAGVPDLLEFPLTGPANHVKQVFHELKVLGHQVRLLAIQDKQIWKTDDFEHFEKVSVRLFDQGFTKVSESVVRRIQSELKLPYFALFESLRFAQACVQELSDWDVLYERMGWMGYGGVIAAQRLKIPHVLEVNGDHLSEFEFLGIDLKGAQRSLSLFIMKKAVQKTTRVVATGAGWRDRFIERWDVNPDCVRVVENGSEMVELLSRDKLNNFRPHIKSKDGIDIVYIGAFELWHGIQILIRSFANVISQGANVHLDLIGSGTLQNELEEIVHEYEIEQYVSFIGQLDIQEASEYLANADIAVAPYCGRAEFSGLKLLDYKAAGLAIIVSGKNGQPAVIEQDRTGLIVPPCNETALSTAILELVRNKERRMRLGQEARLEAERCQCERR